MQFSWYNCLYEKKSYIFIFTRIALYSLFNSGLCLWISDVFFVCPFRIYQWHPALRLYSSVVFYSHFDLCNSDCCSSSDNLHNQKARKDSLHLVSYSFCEHNFGNCCFGIFLICDWDVLYYFQGRVHVNVSIGWVPGINKVPFWKFQLMILMFIKFHLLMATLCQPSAR